MALHAYVTTVVCAWGARYLDIYTLFTSLPTSCTTGVAIIHHTSCRLHEAGCEKQAEGYKMYFHYGAINISLIVNILSTRTFTVLTRKLNGLSGEFASHLTPIVAGLISRSQI